MFSAILTKVNKANLQFKEYAFLKQAATTPELLQFVQLMHKGAQVAVSVLKISVFTSKGSYEYYNYPPYFKRVNTITSDKPVFWKQS